MRQRLWFLLAIAVPVLLADQAGKTLAIQHAGARGALVELGSPASSPAGTIPVEAPEPSRLEERMLIDGVLGVRLSPNQDLQASRGVGGLLPARLVEPLQYGAGLLALAFLIWFTLSQTELSRRLQAGLAALIGGAAGNLLDRLLHGAVLDWLQWHGPGGASASFTLGDLGIWSGVGVLVFELVRPRDGRLTGPATAPPALPGV